MVSKKKINKSKSKAVQNSKVKPLTNQQSINKQLRALESRLEDNASTLRTEAIRQLLNPGKDINYSCGYPDTISTSDYRALYDREGLAARVVSIWPDESWAMIPEIYETEKEDVTEFEKQWKKLLDDIEIFHYLHRIDVLSGIGRFGILLLGLDDGKELREPVEGINELTGEKVGTGKQRKLLYLRPFDENVVKIDALEKDASSPRFENRWVVPGGLNTLIPFYRYISTPGRQCRPIAACRPRIPALPLSLFRSSRSPTPSDSLRGIP